MNKTEFLLALQRQINMLEDDEQKDIVDEYSQHIDMKIQNGMTEDEAIEDFGPLDQLVGEILGAYHVKAPSPAIGTAGVASAQDKSPADAEKAKGHAAENLIAGSKRAASSVAEGIKKGASGIKNAAGEAGSKAKAAAAQAGTKAKKSSEAAASKTKQGLGGMASGVAKGGTALGSGLMKAASTCVRWCWNFFVACICAMFFLFAVVFLFSLGFCLVLQIQGYPLLGICLCALGLLMASISLMLLCARLFWRKPASVPMREGVIPQAHSFGASWHAEAPTPQAPVAAAQPAPAHSATATKPLPQQPHATDDTAPYAPIR